MSESLSDADIRRCRDEYKLALKTETQASPTVRTYWRKTVEICSELLRRRAGKES
jgi:hypothetical protein